MSVSAPLVRASLADLVYDRLLDGILSGTLPCGSHLNVADTARELQVSPSPVREALLRLATEGLVANNTNRRATVISFATSEVKELFEVREILECGVARLAAGRVTDAELKEIRAVMERCAALGDKPSRKKEMLDLDHRFHLSIADASGNRILRDEMLRCTRRVRVLQWLRLDFEAMHIGYAEHLAIVEALERRDPEGAQAAMSAHIRAALGHLLEGIRRDSQDQARTA